MLYHSSIGGVDRSILFIYANRFKDAQNRFYERVLVWRPKPVLREGLGMGVVLRGELNEMQNVLVRVWFHGVIMMYVYVCFGVYDCFMPGDTIPPNQPDSVAFI